MPVNKPLMISEQPELIGLPASERTRLRESSTCRFGWFGKPFAFLTSDGTIARVPLSEFEPCVEGKKVLGWDITAYGRGSLSFVRNVACLFPRLQADGNHRISNGEDTVSYVGAPLMTEMSTTARG